MQAPLALIDGSFALTAIFVRWPASRASDTISTSPAAISGTSSANSLRTSPGCVRDTVICGPFVPLATDVTYTRRREPWA